MLLLLSSTVTQETADKSPSCVRPKTDYSVIRDLYSTSTVQGSQTYIPISFTSTSGTVHLIICDRRDESCARWSLHVITASQLSLYYVFFYFDSAYQQDILNTVYSELSRCLVAAHWLKISHQLRLLESSYIYVLKEMASLVLVYFARFHGLKACARTNK